MTAPVIDPATFAELQDSAGADFVAELVGTFLEEAPALLVGPAQARAYPCGRAVLAVLAALEVSESIALLNADRQAESKPPLKVGIGIATGDVVAGHTGTQQRATYTYTYTCIGDTVNLAARLEAYTKDAQRMILIDDATCAALGGRMPVTPLGPVQLKSKAASVDVHAVNP